MTMLDLLTESAQPITDKGMKRGNFVAVHNDLAERRGPNSIVAAALSRKALADGIIAAPPYRAHLDII